MVLVAVVTMCDDCGDCCDCGVGVGDGMMMIITAVMAVIMLMMTYDGV